ncbi:MAG: hypothetical protein ACT4P7_01535 [Gemmatimonadaceae bacterium]
MTKVVAATSHDGNVWVFCEDGSVYASPAVDQPWTKVAPVPGTPITMPSAWSVGHTTP